MWSRMSSKELQPWLGTKCRGQGSMEQKMQQNRHSWVESDGSMLKVSANDCAHFLDQNRPTNPDGDKDDQ